MLCCPASREPVLGKPKPYFIYLIWGNTSGKQGHPYHDNGLAAFLVPVGIKKINHTNKHFAQMRSFISF